MENPLYLTGKTAIVTGGSRGIGLGITKKLLAAGANVVIASYSEQELTEVESELSSYQDSIKTTLTDVTIEEDVKNLVRAALDTYGSIDILVNNAGIFPVTPVLEMTAEQFERVIDVNLKGVFLCSKYVASEMVKRNTGGKIINITSVDALHPSGVGLAHYDASKHGVWGFTKNLALELAPHNIWVNAVAPGSISTPGTAELQQNPGSSNMNPDEFLKKIPMRRPGEPEDIGKVVLFLASDLSSYITGEQIVVDGGMLLS